jgi:PAS domain S-box-containing protein
MSDEARYRVLVDAITDYAIYMLDRDGRVVSWNPGARRFKGYEAWEIIGQSFTRFYTPEDQATGLPERALATAANEGRFEAEGWRMRKDGTRFWAYVVIDPIRAEDGTLLGYAKVTRDLTERKRSEEALNGSEQQFRLLVQGVTDYAIYMLDPDGHVTNWNLGAERIKGYREAEIIGQHFSRFYTPEDREAGEPARTLATAAREGRFEMEGWRLRKDGTRFRAHVVVDAIHDETGKLVGFAKVTRDVTDRTEAQHALERAREALFQAQKMEAVGQLTGGVAHDFNNLLMAVLGSLELVQKRLPYNPRVTPLIENAIQGAQRGAALTQRMLAFARRQALDPKPVDLVGLVEGMRGLLQRSLGPAASIETRFPPDLPVVLADNNQLELALLNLTMNARDAMPSGGPIMISAFEELVGPGHRSALPPARYVCLTVTDSGEGMDDETLARAMEPFFTTKGIGKGTGLGLPMVHGLAEQSGGRFLLKSRLTEGTTAELWLPLAHGAPQDETERSAAAEASTSEALVVLAVDDDALVLMNTTAMLEDLGHRVLEASSAGDALDILRRGEKIDLVVTDHAMPGMTGAQLATIIGAERPDLPIVLATGYAELPSGIGAGLLKLDKPFRQADLARLIDQAMQGRSSSRVVGKG